MAPSFHRNPIKFSAQSLETLTSKYHAYTEGITPTGDDRAQYEEYCTAINLITGGTKIIKSSQNSLQNLINKLEKLYEDSNSDGMKKEVEAEIEKIDKESQVNARIAKANDTIFVLEARINEYRDMAQKLAINLGLDPHKRQIYTEKNSGNPEKKIETLTGSHDTEDINSADAQWLSEDISEVSVDQGDMACRTLKPKQMNLPRFYGDEEEFPEYWVIYETLVHENKVLNTVEKMLLLKDSLKGRAEMTIKGIQLIPQNYKWMTEELKKKFGNKPVNRAKIVQKLSDMRPASNSGESCGSVYDKIRMLINQMVSAGQDIRAVQDALWTEKILEKFPYNIVKNVLISIQNQDDVTVDDVMKEIEKEITAKKFIDARLRTRTKPEEPKRNDSHPTGDFKKSTKCVFCGQNNHSSAYCRALTDGQSKRNIVQERKLCWKCFANNHTSFECSWANCSQCGQAHNRSLCIVTPDTSHQRGPSHNNRPFGGNKSFPQRSTGNRPTATDSRPNPWRNQHSDRRNNSNQANMHTSKVGNLGAELYNHEAEHRNKEQIVLMTALGSIWNYRSEQFEQVLFFFDTGAQKTIIREEISQQFGLPCNKTEICTMSGIGGHIEQFQSNFVKLKISDAYGKELNIEVHTKPIITNGFPSVKLVEADKEYLRVKEINICNPRLRGEHQTPHILVGLDYYYDIVLDNASTTTPSGLRIAKTIFGPTLHGRGTLSSSFKPERSVEYGLTAVFNNNESNILQNLFELEGLGISSVEGIKEDKVNSYLEDYAKTIVFKNGHITAPFPLKDNIIDLCDNYAIAFKRLIALQNQLANNNELRSWYCRIMSDYLTNDVIEEVKYGSGILPKYYMPHSGVWRPEKPKPLRIVFDASSKKKGKLSLNDVIFKGESFINKIHDILTASRANKVIILCDIEAAFTQIRLDHQHKDLCRFLWLNDVNRPASKENITEFRFKRLPFGINASPSILNMSIMSYLLSLNDEIASEMANNLYVDNILLSASTTEEAIVKYKKSKAIFARIGMNLREYISNSEEVNAEIPECDKGSTGKIKFLGVQYSTETDEFSVETAIHVKEKMTKRDIVSQLNSIYDPIGIAAPLLIRLKHLMREIYSTNLEWNDTLSSDLSRRWVKVCLEVRNVAVSIPRYVDSTIKGASLWAFCDASEIALATCCFLRSTNISAVSSLISGKTKLTPKKGKQTIPRLELLALLMGTRLSCNIYNNISNLIHEINIVTDSKVALAWIKSSRKLPLFVANQKDRVNRIVSELKQKQVSVNFYYVSTRENPADAGTRGLSAADMSNHSWLRGPKWLAGEKITWPLISIDNIAEQNYTQPVEEITQTNVEISEDSLSQESNKTIDLTRFSRISTAKRTMAIVGKGLKRWILSTNTSRAVDIKMEILNKFSDSGQINVTDIVLAERLFILQEQSTYCIKELQKRHPQKRLVKDSFGIIRYVSRLQNACIPEDTKSPIFIPCKSDLARLIVMDIHKKNAHCGKEQLLTIVRQRFWIPQPSGLIKTHIRQCAICRKCHGLPFSLPEMAPLPKDRVLVSKTFEKVGCDFLGPIESHNQEKMYVCLYTCLTTRAVHLEVVENLSTGAFLDSFIRFISRRGVPKYVRSDCGSNFKLGQKIIQSLFEDEAENTNAVMSYCAAEGIQWIFNPPGAPWMGGVWERLVGSVKRALQKTFGRKKLTFTQLCTAVARIEAILNTRPITKVQTSDLSEIPLRPIDFLGGNVSFSVPDTNVVLDMSDPLYDPELIQTVTQAKEALEFSERMSSKFWEKWSFDYLTALRDTQTNKSKQRRAVTRSFPQVGELVLVEQELIPRGSWVYGKVQEIAKSSDGQVRTVKVLMPNHRTLQKPINKLYPMEIRSIPDNVEPSLNEGGNMGPPPTSERRVLPSRRSKTLAYEVIQNFENSLEDNTVQTAHVEEGDNRKTTRRTGAVTRYSSSSSHIYTVLLIFACAIQPTWTFAHADGRIQCIGGIIKIDPPSDRNPYEVCFANDCRKYTNQTSEQLFYLGVSPLNKCTNVTLKMIRANKVISQTEACAPPKFCSYAQNFMSKGLLGNPHCWPLGAIMSVFLIIYLALATILLIVMSINMKLKQGRVSGQHIQQIVGRERPSIQSVPLQSFNPTPLSKVSMLTVCCVIASIMQTATGCQHGYMRHTVNLLCSQKGSCTYEYNEEVNFNRLHSNLCIQIKQNNETAGFVKFNYHPLKLTCSKVSHFFTRDSVPKIFHIRRCPQMGSCHDDRCSTFQRDEIIPELNETARYPGYATCASSCAGIACGCLLPTPSCSFYRFVHVPVTQIVYQIVECLEWKPTITVEIETTLYNKVSKARYTLQPYVRHSIGDFNVTIISIQKPQSPFFGKKFAISAEDSVIIPEHYRLPIECVSEEMASKNFSQCSTHFDCICHDNHSKAGCNCLQESISEIRSGVINSLPINTPTTALYSKNGDVILHSMEAEVLLVIQSKVLLIANQFAVEQPCEIRSQDLIGCYDCAEGAQIKISCKTENATRIIIQCDDQTFSIECNPQSITNVVNLDFNNAVVHSTCEANCGGQSEIFLLKGTLLFHEERKSDSVFHDKQSYVSQPMHWLNDIKLPNIMPILNTIKENWRVTTIAVAALGTLMGVTYLFGPLMVVLIIRSIPPIVFCAGKCASSIARVTWTIITTVGALIRRISAHMNH